MKTLNTFSFLARSELIQKRKKLTVTGKHFPLVSDQWKVLLLITISRLTEVTIKIPRGFRK
ncbi:hypothetical protein COT48_02635 [Candidatus Woesearchaeota archaeon CG08_land_8_20_14_0_20_47_9]|nr:MAG: hypothetical protein AUJ69_02370 [Candidatus Woesearchaeota archaeon CG1_02_47_18]PIO04002.1 MAG: hypothetical protein COT48_02635 [Candidatus Woesearchaeota archaeon CG08_land_8_20_14_0_20_47_9]